MYESIIILLILCIMSSAMLKQMYITILLTILLLLIIIITMVINKKSNKNNDKNDNNINYIYTKKQFMTNNELSFYYKIIDLENDYKIIPQVNLASIIKKENNNHYQNELYRNIDFAIFTKDYSKLLLLIELNDQTHEKDDRKKRDKKVKEICYKAGIRLISFYTKYPNEKQYVIDRILNEINKSNDNV